MDRGGGGIVHFENHGEGFYAYTGSLQERNAAGARTEPTFTPKATGSQKPAALYFKSEVLVAEY